MAPYKKIKNNQPKFYNPVGPQNPVTPADLEHAHGLRETEINTEPAEVVDVILNPDHPHYDSSIPDPEEQVGMIQIRRIHTDQNLTDQENLPWAVPLTKNIKQYPSLALLYGLTDFHVKGDYFGLELSGLRWLTDTLAISKRIPQTSQSNTLFNKNFRMLLTQARNSRI